MNKRLLSAALVCAAIATAFAVSPELNGPRVGDSLKATRIAGEPTATDSVGLSLDLSRAAFEGTYDFSCWKPSRLDSVAAMLIISDREIYRLATKDRHQYVLDRTIPGITRRFDSEIPYGLFPDSLKSVAVESRGKMDGIGTFRSDGETTQKIVSGLSVIIAPGDTLRNVECAVTDIRERVEVAGLDTALHISRISRWYAPGYRYPIVTGEKAVSVTLYGDTVDIVSNWSVMLPAHQEEEITDDPVNGMIRASLAGNGNTPSHRIPSAPGGHTSGDDVCVFDRDRREITINRTFTGAETREYVLGDFAGRVYAHGEMGPSTPGVTLSTAGFTPGAYFIHITTDSEPVVYKFLIEQ